MSARWRNSFDNRNKRCCGTCDSDLDNSDRDNSGGRATVADIPDSRAVGQGKRDNWSGPVGRDTWDNSTVRASAFCCALDTVGILNPVGDSLDWGKDKADTRCWSQQDTMDTHRSWNAPCRSQDKVDNPNWWRNSLDGDTLPLARRGQVAHQHWRKGSNCQRCCWPSSYRAAASRPCSPAARSRKKRPPTRILKRSSSSTSYFI